VLFEALLNVNALRIACAVCEAVVLVCMLLGDIQAACSVASLTQSTFTSVEASGPLRNLTATA